ncbi:DUF1304 family protein [Bradyrhizobium sp. STM 3843]|uniref:DUF1304 family protein n=1 Tax=Bradyrhizobium sp. STM 3843 TaxID=551947 RepID=UPI001111E5FA|nr:DUF1304 family protein [Bradyrhizobium sp. STM 3843]
MLPKVLVLLTIVPHCHLALQSTVFEWLAPENRMARLSEGTLADAMPSNTLYNVFLLTALILAFFHPDPLVARSFAWFWLMAVVIGSVWNAVTSRIDGRYHAFLVAALSIGLLDRNPEVASAFSVFGLACVIASGLRCAWIDMESGGLINCSIPAALALAAVVGKL